jgi:hypothetical protein
VLSGWVVRADAAGLDDGAIVALFSSVLRDFRERRDGSAGRPDAADGGEAERVA